MPNAFDSALLHGRWLHAHEEDQQGREVYRPDSVQLPPARGRSGFTFESDGRAAKIGPGPTDRSTSSSGTWKLDPHGRLTIRLADGPEEAYQVESIAPDRLVLKK